ncbi:MAG: JAB domain-containing protein [Bacteroidetes bacterium]|nr:JAB domain-containing protein [Bacteroidota bacterium]
MRSKVQSMFSVSEIELFYRNKVNPADRHKILSPENAYDVFLQMWDMNKIGMVEQCYMMMVDQSHNCLGVSHIATGGIAVCLIDPRVVFATALRVNSSAIFLAHNHPSENLKPSKADDCMTENIVKAGKMLGIQVMDHLIISPHNFYSYAKECRYVN